MSIRSHAKSLARCLALGLLTVLPPAAVGAAPDHLGTADEALPSGFELIAFEAPGCRYCPVLRRDVLPSYAATRAGKKAPIRFVDLNDAAADSFKLNSPITMVPTLVLVHDGVEIGRISGYFGRENVHRILDDMLPAD